MRTTHKSEAIHVTALGAALVDIYAHIDEAELAIMGSIKGSMTLIDEAASQNLRNQIHIESRASGGSAANTIAGIAGFGLKTAFMGRVGDDELGQFFAREMADLNIHFSTPPHHSAPTGHCLILLTPDAERTMHTSLGASGTIAADDMDEDILENTLCLFSEGYVFDSAGGEAAFLRASQIVKKNGGRVVLSLADPFCVERHITLYKKLLSTQIDFILGNEKEAAQLFATKKLEKMITIMRAQNIDGVITRSEKGAVVVMKGDVYEIAPKRVDHIADLTGAGDQFAAGFLVGFAQNKPPPLCGELGAQCAARVIGHMGARPK